MPVATTTVTITPSYSMHCPWSSCVVTAAAVHWNIFDLNQFIAAVNSCQALGGNGTGNSKQASGRNPSRES